MTYKRKSLELSKYIKSNTDKYFTSTKKIIEYFGDKKVVYGFFLRTDSLYAPYFILSWLDELKADLKLKYQLYEMYKEGEIIKAESPIFFLEGSFSNLVELETLLLQKLSWSGSIAMNAYNVAMSLPSTEFISMGVRHYSSPETAAMVDYAVSVASLKATKEGAKGFKGSTTINSNVFFGLREGIGTMPHALIGYAGSTLEAAKMYFHSFREEVYQTGLVVLIDYFGQEITDSLLVCEYFKDLSDRGLLSVRVDTNGANYLEGLDAQSSLEIIERYTSRELLSGFSEYEKQYAYGKGVTAAAVFKLREELDKAGLNKVKIVASSGFTLEKCLLMAKLQVPIDCIGTGSLVSNKLQKNFAVADIVSYDDKLIVKKGRESLKKAWQKYIKNK